MPRLEFSDIQAAVAAVGRGEAQQIRVIIDDIYARLDDIETGSSDSGKLEDRAGQRFDSLDPAEAPADDAKSVDVRESVIDLTEKVNQIIRTLKGEY